MHVPLQHIILLLNGKPYSKALKTSISMAASNNNHIGQRLLDLPIEIQALIVSQVMTELPALNGRQDHSALIARRCIPLNACRELRSLAPSAFHAHQSFLFRVLDVSFAGPAATLFPQLTYTAGPVPSPLQTEMRHVELQLPAFIVHSPHWPLGRLPTGALANPLSRASLGEVQTFPHLRTLTITLCRLAAQQDISTRWNSLPHGEVDDVWGVVYESSEQAYRLEAGKRLIRVIDEIKMFTGQWLVRKTVRLYRDSALEGPCVAVSAEGKTTKELAREMLALPRSEVVLPISRNDR